MLRRLVPVLGWLPRYDRKLLRGDLAAGIAVTALVVPKNLGYAEIAGVPVQNGLYAAAAGALIYAIFGTSRQVSTGPSSSLAAVAGGAVLVTQLSGNAAAQLVAAIAVVTGVLFLLVAIFKLGWIARFMSKAVVTGFLAGAAIDVIIGELPKITGTSAEGDNAWRELISWFGSIDGTDLTTLAVGIGGLALIFGLRRFAPRTPGALVVVVAGLLASALFDLGANGVALVGDVPSGLPTPELPDWNVLVGPCRHDCRRLAGAAADRLLADDRRRAGVRDAPRIPDRHRSGIRRARYGEHRRRRPAGNAGVHESFREFAERIVGREVRRRIVRDRRIGGADPAVPCAALLRPAESGAGGGRDRRSRLRDDRCRRASPAESSGSLRFRHRNRGGNRRAARRASFSA